jgi:hypothetical protein
MGLEMKNDDDQKRNPNDLTNLIEKLKERIYDLDKRMKDLNSFVKPNGRVCEQCSHPFLERNSNFPLTDGSTTPSELDCPKCGYKNIVEKV